MASSAVDKARVGVIGGSAFYAMDALEDPEKVRMTTPFGSPSDDIVVGSLSGQRVAFLPRHGVGHRLLPSEVPSLANIYALKMLGVEFIVGVSAVGSLREEIEPTHFVVPDQLVDQTRGRVASFFGRGLVAHVPLAEPFCPNLRSVLADAVAEVGAEGHSGGTYVCIEGPQFSTRAESELYRSWGADVVGMTALPEAKLAREAEICYALLAAASDYDCWHPHEESVTAEMVVHNLDRNVAAARRALLLALAGLPDERACACSAALEHAFMTSAELVPTETRRDLAPIVGKYLSHRS